jgi:chromate transport protein ChrA
MIRWPVQVATLIAFALALIWCWRLYRAHDPRRPYLGFVLVFLFAAVGFYLVLMARIVLAGFTEPTIEPVLNWLANTLLLLCAVCLALTMYSASRGDG